MNPVDPRSTIGELDGMLAEAVAAVLAEPAPEDVWRRVEARALEARSMRAPPLAASRRRRSSAHSRIRLYAASIVAAAMLIGVSLGAYFVLAAHWGRQRAPFDRAASPLPTASDPDGSHAAPQAADDATNAAKKQPGSPPSPDVRGGPSALRMGAYIPSNVRAVVAESAPVLVANGPAAPVTLGGSVAYFDAKQSLHVWNWQRSDVSRVVKDVEFGNRLAAALSPDGRILVQADGRGVDLTSGKKSTIELGGAATRVGEAVYGRIGDMRFSPDGGRLAMHVTALVPGEPGRIAGEFVDIVAFPSGKRLARFPAGEAYVLRIDFSADGKRVFSATPGRQLQCHSSETGEVLASYEPPLEHQILAAAASPDGRYAACHDEAELLIWERETGRLAQRIKFGEPVGVPLGTLCFSPDGEHVAAGRAFGVRIYDTASGREVAVWHESAAVHLRWSPDGKVLTAITAPVVGEAGDRPGGARYDVYPAVHRWDVKNGKRLMPPTRTMP